MQGKRGSKRSEQNLAMLGHELCSALNGIQGMTELLSGTRLNGEQKQFVEAMKLSIGQMNWLIGGINSLRHSTVFPFSPERRVLDGPGLLEQAVRCHTRAAMIKNNLLLLVIDPQLPQRWFGDARLLRQIIDNLLGNAIKFTQSGLVVIEARRAPAGQGKDTGLELLVRDTGIGFNQAASRRIFKPFVQAGSGIGRVHGGAGLGLYICRRIVSRLNGQLDCISKPGLGSSFRITLPDALEPGPCEERAVSSDLLSSMTCQVSVQDELGRSLEFLLQRIGIKIEPCPDGEKLYTDVEFRVEISLADPCGHDALVNHCLLFTPGSVRSNAGPLSGIRRMQPPFLASTLGPMLMEMALEQRLDTCQ
ncbi:MAG: HAMP domain-containing sensor histidine kinase [Xanthomonadales bacterium]